ncbi:MAG TPA: hypothetical protein VHF89_19960, partial [Solirubrobacteraceae bacterium]|nr:hypothetical protein [Solirubrobacteraceae bacterium]
PRRRRLLWIAIAVLLTVGPLAFTLAREGEFRVSRVLFPRAVGPYPAPLDLRYYDSLVRDGELRRRMVINEVAGLAEYEDVSFRFGPRPTTVTISVSADTPQAARRFINVLVPQLAGATQREVVRVALEDVEGLRARLRDARSGRERARLRRRLRRLESVLRVVPGRVLFDPPAGLPRLESWADRLVDDLPGDFPARPDPAWAALAGLLVAVTLWAICLVLLPPGRGRDASPGP